MAKQKLKSKRRPESVITSFTSNGEYFAILYPYGTVKVWSTKDGSLFSEWKASGEEANYSCMALSCNKKKGKKGWNCLLALGTNDGQVMVIDLSTSQMKWESSRHSRELVGVSFVNKGNTLFTLGKDGLAIEMNPGNGEILKEHKISKRPLSSFGFSSDQKIFALVEEKIRVMGLESGEELLKLSDNIGPVHHMSLSNDAKNMVTSGPAEKCIRVWTCDVNSKNFRPGPSLPIKKPATALECMNVCNDEDNSIVLAVSGVNLAYIWSLNCVLQDDIKSTKVRIKAHEDGTSTESTKSSYSSIITARLDTIQIDDGITVLIVHGSIDSPQFIYVKIKNPGDDIVVPATDDTGSMQEIDGSPAEAISHAQGKKSSKKRAASDAEILDGDAVDTGHEEIADGAVEEDNLNEPTMGEKLEELTLAEDGKKKSNTRDEQSPKVQPPSADSVNVLLKQALRADDRALLLDCLYTRDEKVIANSIALLNPSDVFKLLQFLVSIIHSRGAVLVCALPWLRRLIIQHASGIMSQESTLAALNSLYQLIESRVATFQPALELSSHLDFIYAGDLDEIVEEQISTKPVIYEDKDDSEEEELEDAMETDHENNGEEASDVVFEDFSDAEGIEEMSD